jgi:Disulphide bond corrector protein DsbC
MNCKGGVGVIRQAARAAAFSMLLIASVVAQDTLGRKSPSVTFIPPTVADVSRGKANTVELGFRVSPGFHINSNKPGAEYLIPTVLKIDPPTDIAVGKITYPDGEEMTFPFAPNDKLSVYSGNFTLGVVVRPLASVLPGKYEFRGQMRYQACDNAACYPPKTFPVQFEVKVVKAPHAAAKNPAQSPHVHN